MARKVIGPTGSPRRRWLFLCTTMAAIAMAVLFIPSAFAVHEFSMQLDGDVSTHAYSVPGSQAFDWGANTCNVADSTPPSSCVTGIAGQTDTAHSIFLASRSGSGTSETESVDPNPATVGSNKAFDAANFQRDFESGTSCTLNSTSTTRCSADITTYATGSKDTLGIGNGGWQCNKDNNVNNKVDINNAYVASFWSGGSSGSGDHILYAGIEKEKNNGTNDIGVWFLQSGASCSNPNGGSGKNWTGGHRNGDVLVVSEFSNGGGVSTVKTFTWRASTDPNSPFFGDGGCIDSRVGFFNPKTGGCNGLQSGGGGDCKSATLNDTTCATTNAQFKVDPTTGKSVAANPYAGTVSTPWLASDATLGIGNNQVVAPDYIEMGIDLTKLFAGTGEAAPSCFNTAVPDTRSSPSVTATLFDYTVNTIGECGSSTVTTPQDGSGTSIPAAGLSIGANAAVAVRDHADITVTGFTGSFGGTVTFYLCGPLALNSTSNCNNTDTAGPPAVVDTNGVQIGDPVAVSGSGGSASVNSSDSGGDVNGNTVLTSVGRYCWRAVYSGDGDIPGSVDPATTSSSTSECFKITPIKPTLTTSATCESDPCVIGSVLDDTASLSGTADQPGTNGIGAATAFSAAGTIDATDQAAADSSITWTVYGPASDGSAQCTTAISNAPTPSSVTVSGDNTSYGPVKFTTTATTGVGKYEFAAAYAGNSPNTSAADAVGCDTTGTNGEQVTVIGSATSSSLQGWLPNDRITINSTAGTKASGTITVTLYYGAFTGTLADCGAGTSLQKFQDLNKPVTTSTSSATFVTDNSTFYVGHNPNDGTAGGPDTDATHSYFWLIHFVSDQGITNPPDRCESATITHNDG
jgi:hypothetical protein